MIPSAEPPSEAKRKRGNDLSGKLHDLRTPLNQIIGLSEMLMEIAEEDGRRELLDPLSILRDCGIELAGMLEEKRLVPVGEQEGTGFRTLREITQVATDRVVSITSELLSTVISPTSDEYQSDLNKIRQAVLRFVDLAVVSNLVAPAKAIVPTSTTPAANRLATRVTTSANRILIVDDEELNVDVLTRRLRREGYQPTGVSSGPAALELLRSCEFDVILLDLMMPGMSGIDVLQLLKHDGQLQHVPVIMLSAVSDVERVAQCIELGAEDYLPKPVNSTLLRARLGACLEKKHLRDKEQAYFRAMHAEKERLSVTLRSVADAVITTDAKGRITLVNEVGETFASTEHSSAVGRPFEEVFRIVHRETGKPIASPAAEALARNAPFDAEPGISMTCADMRERLVSVRSAPMHDQDGTIVGAVIVIRDITERERMASELQQAAKLQSIGFLAGGLAHHYNNMLTAVLGNLSLLPHQWDIPPEAIHTVREAEQGATRAKELTSYLLTFAGGGAPIREVLKLRPLMDEMCNSATRGSRVECFSFLPEDLWDIEADPRQIAQVFESIITNAVEAMPGGGLIFADAENVHAPLGAAPSLAQGAYVRIRFQDHGSGIRPEDLPHVCDPFFSTKEHARGLGLSAAYSILQRHGGQILIESVVDSGTTVTCYVPAHQPATSDAASASAAPLEGAAPPTEEAPLGSGNARRQRVLVMDDEEAIRSLTESMLSLLDYDVVTTAHGEEALAAHAQATAEGRPFDFAIMDLRIPGGMGGGETMRRIRAIDPSIRAIVASGYSDDPVMADFASYGFNGVLPKPYLMGDLVRVLSLAAAPPKA